MTDMAGGRVVLVGGGPGADDLITVRGLDRLLAADVVITDRLAPTGLLARLAPHVEVIDAGREPGRAKLTYDQIVGLMIDRARTGKTVVRLKGGDPFVFAHGAQEVRSCTDAGVPVEVVPGVTSATAAPVLAGVPLTSSEGSAGFIVASGHLDPGDPACQTDWAGLAWSGLNIVILMGMRHLPAIVARLIEEGVAADATATCVANASLPGQQAVRAGLGELAAAVAAAGLANPAVVVVETSPRNPATGRAGENGVPEPTLWPRPVPLVGDTTSAAERAADLAGWAMGDEVVSSLQAVLAARRDVRRYRPDAVPPDLLRQVLAAGHQAPSVGHSQPWRFVVVTSQATRDRAAMLADRERLRQAAALTPERRDRMLDLQLDGIREAPAGIVVACDRRAPAVGVLGRAGFGDADLWSCACAVQNMWLAARAAGLGLGWVTLFQPADLSALLSLPEGVETLGWLCLGWPDERPPEPGLERHGWSRRLPLDEVIISEHWPADGGPDAPVSHLAAPDQHAVVGARDSGDDLLMVPGSLGVLDIAVNRALALCARPPTGGTLVLASADHPVARYGVSAYPVSVAGDVLAATRRGVSLGAAAARQADLHVAAVHAVCPGDAGDLVHADAMPLAAVRGLVRQGEELGRRLAADGLVCLGEVGIGNTTVAAALACVLAGLEPDAAAGLGAGSDTAIVDRKRDVIARAVGRARAEHAAGLTDPWVLMAALGGPEIAFLTGVTLGAARARVPVILDGLVTSVSALVAVRIEPAAQSALVAGQLSREPAHPAVLTELGLEPLLQLRLRAGEGVGACLAAQLLLTGMRVRQITARVGPPG
jgi:nicotinate-nucleotide--dimethylbenzimidazole phosphoribosyltransferase